MPLDQRGPAGGATRVLPGTNLARKVAGVDETQSFGGADLCRTDQSPSAGRLRLGHLVILVEGGDVPGNVRADRDEKACGLAQFLVAVVEAGDDERDNLQPEAALEHHADGAQDVFQGAAQLAIAAFGKALEVDLVGDDPGAQKVEDLGRGVAVGDKGTGQAGGGRLPKDADRPFGRDQRLVVAGDDQPSPFPSGQFGQLRRSHGTERGRCVRIT